MDDHSRMYRDLTQGLQRMDYYNGIQSFINYALSNLRNISRGSIRCSCKSCKNKKISRSRCCNNAYTTKRVHGAITVLVCTRRTICS